MRVRDRMRFPALAIAILGLALFIAAGSRVAHAQAASPGLSETPIGPAGGGLPATSIAPADQGAPPPPPEEPAAPAAAPTVEAPEFPEAAPTESPAEQPTVHREPKPIVHKAKAPTAATAPAVAVVPEPVKGRLKLKQDTWVFEQPSKWSKQLEPAPTGNFVDVTGITHYYLRVKLKNGGVGFVPIDAVAIVLPTDKYFELTHDAAVVDAPSRFGKKLSEVHKGHAVHVTGVALSYLQIRMRSGLLGFIPASALE